MLTSAASIKNTLILATVVCLAGLLLAACGQEQRGATTPEIAASATAPTAPAARPSPAATFADVVAPAAAVSPPASATPVRPAASTIATGGTTIPPSTLGHSPAATLPGSLPPKPPAGAFIVPSPVPTAGHPPNPSPKTTASPSPRPTLKPPAASTPTVAPSRTAAPAPLPAPLPPANATPAKPTSGGGLKTPVDLPPRQESNLWVGPPNCTGDHVTFAFPPVEPDHLLSITPQGKLHGSHVTPTDHTYFTHDKLREYEKHSNSVRRGGSPQPWSPPYDVRAPGDGIIVSIEPFPFGPAPYGYSGILEDYRVIIWHSCTVSTIYIHLGGLAPEILEVTGQISGGSRWSSTSTGQGIPVKAGQVIGKVGAQGIDFSVHDTRVTLSGLLVPSHYDGEPWKIHTVDPFDYFESSVKARLLQKNLRTAAPRGGKIDYDVDGRLVGNWFMEGSKDYGGGGLAERLGFCGNRPCPYWVGHLAIAYDHIEPSQIRISIGAETGIGVDRCRVCQGVYGVEGNAPDPANVSVESGLLKYELVARETLEEQGVRERTRNLQGEVLAVFLVEMLQDRTIKVEVFPGRSASQVTGFSEAARLYHR